MFRLRQKHSRKQPGRLTPVDADALVRAQSVKRALLAAFSAVVIFTSVWMWVAAVTGKFFPWFAVLQGALTGVAVQRLGRGLDWRFPTIAGIAAVLGSFAGGFFVALSTTGAELQAGAFSILSGLTTMTWEIYFDEVVTPVDYIYAFCAASVAIFYANRRLNRHEELALRLARKNT
jgi:hypothetical protein